MMLIYQKRTIKVMAMTKIKDEDYRVLMIKMDMVIEYLESHGGIGDEMYSFECVMSHEEVSFDIVDVATDIKTQIEWLYQEDDDYFPF